MLRNNVFSDTFSKQMFVSLDWFLGPNFDDFLYVLSLVHENTNSKKIVFSHEKIEKIKGSKGLKLTKTRETKLKNEG